MDQAATQARVKQLVELAIRNPLSEEGRSAAVAAWKLVHQSGLLVMRTDEIVSFVIPPTAPTTTEPKKKRRARKPSEILDTTTKGIVTTVDAASRVVTSLNGLRDVLRGGR